MSATKVRLSIYEGILTRNPEIFIEKYGIFYDEYAHRIYEAIASIGEEVGEEQLRKYISCKDPSFALGIQNKSRRKGKRENRYRLSKKPKRSNRRQTKGSRQRNKGTKRR